MGLSPIERLRALTETARETVVDKSVLQDLLGENEGAFR